MSTSKNRARRRRAKARIVVKVKPRKPRSPRVEKGKYAHSKDPEERKAKRGGAVRKEVHRKMMDELFKDKTFTVTRKINLPKHQFVKSALGHRILHGWEIRCNETGQLLVVGYKLMLELKNNYQNVTNPFLRKGGRPPGSKNKTTIEKTLREIRYRDLIGEGLFVDEDTDTS